MTRSVIGDAVGKIRSGLALERIRNYPDGCPVSPRQSVR